MIIPIPGNSDFTLHNLPFGIFSTEGSSPRVGVAVGEHILDLVKLGETGVFAFDRSVFAKSVLNEFIDLGKAVTGRVRTDIQSWLENGERITREMFVRQSEARMHLPLRIGDYTDFYSSIEHATNVGKLFRDPENALLPNWKHLPVGYHGRSSSIVVSGTPVVRPTGQTKGKDDPTPSFGPSRQLDFELEMAFVIGKSTELGTRISTEAADEHIFGFLLFNDWSARDIQRWEYVPLGPFLGKNFASSVSPWVVTLEALEPFRVAGPPQEPEPLPYLRTTGPKNFDLKLSVDLQPLNTNATRICRSNFRYMYWNAAQQLAHHTVNGCNVRTGDLMASGTISGRDEHSYGSLLEITQAGRQPFTLDDGTQRSFLEDYDTVIMRAYGERDGIRVGFGEVRSQVLPARPA